MYNEKNITNNKPPLKHVPPYSLFLPPYPWQQQQKLYYKKCRI